MRHSGDRYVEVSRRLTFINSAGAAGITLLSVIAIWGSWRAIAIIVAIQALVIGFNAWFSAVLLPRKGPSAEVVRSVVNFTAAVIISHLAGWPVPSWFWLPFVALAFDHLNSRAATWTLAGLCVVQGVAALVDGVHWIYPLSFTALAFYCSEISRIRFGVIRDMLSTSDRQRAELAAAHASAKEANKRLTTEIRVREHVEVELRQAQKLEAIGRLAAGVAHEINTPVQFVSDSASFVRDSLAALFPLLEKYQALRRAVAAGAPAEALAGEVAGLEEEADLAYLMENVPQALDRSREGLERVATIVRSLKEFAYPDRKEMTTVDLNQAITSTLAISKHEYKLVADVETQLGALPAVTCHLGEINQVVLNIVVNAAHAIGDAVKATANAQRGVIGVRTVVDGEDVVISISDTGPGVPAEIRDRIFDPFFTTKEVGKGTGQGLAIARSVVEKHGGHLILESAPGAGATFHIRLPVKPSDRRQTAVRMAALA